MSFREGCFALLWAVALVSADPVIDAARPVVVRDTALIRYLAGDALVATDSLTSGPRSFWQLVPATDTSTQLVLLRNGTEFTRVSAAKSVELRQRNPDMFAVRESAPELSYRPAMARQSPNYDWLNFDLSWKNPLFALPEGLQVGYFAASANGGRFFMEDGWNIKAAKRVQNVHVEAGISVIDEYMNLQKAVRELYGAENFSSWRFSVSVAVPLVRYTLRTESGAMPRYFWLDSGVVNLYNNTLQNEGKGESNKVLAQFENGMEGHASNISHTLELRWWALRYRVLLDGDVYVAPVHEFGFEDLPMGIGTWGVHVLSCNGRMATGASLNLGPYSIYQRDRWGRKQGLRWSPLHLSFDYAEWKRMRIAGGTTFYIDGLWGREEP